MRKIWTVWNNADCIELGAFWHEDEALLARQEVLDEDESLYPDDIQVEGFTVHE